MSAMAIDKIMLEKSLCCKVGKYCMNGAGPVERLLMLKHHLEKAGTAPEYVLYDVSGRIFSGGLAVNGHIQFLPFGLNSEVCREFLSGRVTLFQKWEYCIAPLKRFDDSLLGAVQRGWMNDWTSRKQTRFGVDELKKNLQTGNFWHIGMERESMAAFEEFVNLCGKKNIHLILWGVPNVDLLNQAEPDRYKKVMTYLQDVAAKNSHVSFWDFNPEFSNRYELFADSIHLRPEGQQIVSQVLAEKLKFLIKKNQK